MPADTFLCIGKQIGSRRLENLRLPETARQKKGAVSVPTLAAPVPWAAAAWPFCLCLTRTRTGAAASGPVAGPADRARQQRVVQPQIRRRFARIRWLHWRCCSFLLEMVTGGRVAALVTLAEDCEATTGLRRRLDCGWRVPVTAMVRGGGTRPTCGSSAAACWCVVRARRLEAGSGLPRL
jgi:hypothetical protein